MKNKPFKETKVGQFLSKNAPGIIDTIGDYFPPANILKALVSKSLPPEQQAEFDKLIADHEKEMYALEVQDKSSAREMNVHLNESEHASWLAKNTASLIALAYTAFSFSIYILVLLGQLKANENISILIVNSITNIVMLIVGFYYGSSDRRRSQEATLSKR